jgi:hypothetical protein
LGRVVLGRAIGFSSRRSRVAGKQASVRTLARLPHPLPAALGEEEGKMAAAAAASMGVVREVLGADVVEEVDQPIIDYIANVLADEDFDFGAPEGHGIFEALGELLIDSGCVSDQEHCLQVPPPRTPLPPCPSFLVLVPLPPACLFCDLTNPTHARLGCHLADR